MERLPVFFHIGSNENWITDAEISNSINTDRDRVTRQDLNERITKEKKVASINYCHKSALPKTQGKKVIHGSHAIGFLIPITNPCLINHP